MQTVRPNQVSPTFLSLTSFIIAVLTLLFELTEKVTVVPHVRLKSEEGIVWLDKLGVAGSSVLSCFSLGQSIRHTHHSEMHSVSNSRTSGALAAPATLLFPLLHGSLGHGAVLAYGREKRTPVAWIIGSWQQRTFLDSYFLFFVYFFFFYFLHVPTNCFY